MPIPHFDPIRNALPPHRGVNGKVTAVSPFLCTLCEIYTLFWTTEHRRVLLRGLMDFRAECRSRGIIGKQWIAGSFVEEIETLEDRPPNDIDVVTFVKTPESPADISRALSLPTDISVRDTTKAKYPIDNIFVPFRSPPSGLLKSICYFYGLYTHRKDGTWK